MMAKAAKHLILLTVAFSVVFVGSALQKRGRSEPNDIMETSVRTDDDECGNFCQFALCNFDDDGIPLIFPSGSPLRIPSVARTASFPWICLPVPSTIIGEVIRSSEVLVREDDGRFVKITEFGRTSVTLGPFRQRKTLHPSRLDHRLFSSPRSGIAVQRVLTPLQRRRLDGRCVVMPIRGYTVLGRDGIPARIANVRGKRNCVAFTARSQTPDVVVELHWHNQDDLDLVVVEPDGNRISRTRPHSRTGGFLDQNVRRGTCSGGNTYREVYEYVRWEGSATALQGDYAVSIWHRSSCREGPADWCLTVYVDGEIILDKKGLHDMRGTRPEEIGVYRFFIE